MHVLFVCSRNRLRSPTAEEVFREGYGITVASAGTAPDADDVVTAEHVHQADLILVMERRHKVALTRAFGPILRAKRLVVLGIPDHYAYMDPQLVRLLRERVPQHLRNVREAPP